MVQTQNLRIKKLNYLLKSDSYEKGQDLETWVSSTNSGVITYKMCDLGLVPSFWGPELSSLVGGETNTYYLWWLQVKCISSWPLVNATIMLQQKSVSELLFSSYHPCFINKLKAVVEQTSVPWLSVTHFHFSWVWNKPDYRGVLVPLDRQKMPAEAGEVELRERNNSAHELHV